VQFSKLPWHEISARRGVVAVLHEAYWQIWLTNWRSFATSRCECPRSGKCALDVKTGPGRYVTATAQVWTKYHSLLFGSPHNRPIPCRFFSEHPRMLGYATSGTQKARSQFTKIRAFSCTLEPQDERNSSLLRYGWMRKSVPNRNVQINMEINTTEWMSDFLLSDDYLLQGHFWLAASSVPTHTHEVSLSLRGELNDKIHDFSSQI
jgi:hypothetical protein